METKENVKKFYDEYIPRQKKHGVTPRHQFILKRLKQYGLKSNSKVLEIGCGIGTLSSIIIKELNDGFFLGCDISEESIKVCNDELNRDNKYEFMVTDMSDFENENKFDFIVFPDVLEHIPVQEHANIFKKISTNTHEKTIVVINIPEPKYLNWIRHNKPELLQIIDQSLSMQDLLNNCYPAGFYLEEILPYAIHTQVPNYLSVILNKQTTLEEMNMKSGMGKALDNIKFKFF